MIRRNKTLNGRKPTHIKTPHIVGPPSGGGTAIVSWPTPWRLGCLHTPVKKRLQRNTHISVVVVVVVYCVLITHPKVV